MTIPARSIRVPDEYWVAIQAEAAEIGTTATALLIEGWRAESERRKASPAKRERERARALDKADALLASAAEQIAKAREA